MHKIQDGALTIVAPLQGAVTTVLSPVGDFFHSVAHLPSLQSQNTNLRNQIAALQGQQNQVDALTQENQKALALLHEQSWIAGRRLGARVISHGPSNQEWTVNLDKGNADGVATGMSVIDDAGLVGRVTSVTGHAAKVLLLIDPTHSVGARLTPTGETGLVSGNGEAAMSFDLLPVSATVTPGTTVVTSGYDKGIYPAGIPIGRIVGAQRSSDSLTQSASLEPFVDFNKLSLVVVLLDTHPIAVPGQ
ncbi:MAG: hypothetical protein NVSMB32_05800 [Actinomycetota bacterium]